MKFLADESCDFSVVKALRTAEYDVVAVCEIAPRAEDTKVIDMALHDERILVTEDKDFGQLVFAHGHKSNGVILLRYNAPVRSKIAEDVVRVVRAREKELAGCFVVIQPGRIRISSMPES